MPMPKAMVATMTTPSSRQEPVLVATPHRGFEARVVRQRRDALALASHAAVSSTRLRDCV